MVDHSSNGSAAAPSLQRAVWTAGLGFSAVSLCVFATVAFAGRWMFQHLTVLGAYLTWTVLFIFLGGAVLGPLVAARMRLSKFYLVYGVAFLAYAAGWMSAYFGLRGPAGEWAGSFAGSILMAVVFAIGLNRVRSIPTFALLLFVANSLGYFLGSIPYKHLHAPIGMLLWGVIYGLFLGSGIGAVLHVTQVQRPSGNG